MAKKYTKSEIEGMIKNLKEKEKKARSKWGKAVLDDAQWLLENVLEWNDWEENKEVELTEKYLLNGAENWNQFSWGGSALIYDGDIAEHYSTPSELKKVGFGKTDMGKDVHGKQNFANYVEKRPNANEEWLDVQARALRQAWWAIRDEMNGTTEFSMSLCEFEGKKGKSNFDVNNKNNGNMKLEIYNPKGELVNTITDKDSCVARLIEMLWAKSEKIEKVKMTSTMIEGEEIATFTEHFSNGYKYVLSGVPMNHGYINATKIVNSNNFSLACGSKSNFEIEEDEISELKQEYGQEYLQEKQPDDMIYQMDEIDELFSSAWDALRGAFFGGRYGYDQDSFNPNDDYFYFNGYGNLVSVPYLDEYLNNEIDDDNFIEWCKEQGYYEENDDDDDEEGEDKDNMSIHELSAQHDSRKSFYGKAQVDVDDKTGVQTLYSYGTKVAQYNPKTKKFTAYPEAKYSATTKRHVREFMKQNGVPASEFSIIDDTKDVLRATGKLAGNIVKNTTDKGGLLMF